MKIKKIVDIMIITIALIAIGILSYIIISKTVLKQAYPNIFGYTYMQVKTGSMAPVLNVDDVVIIKLDASYQAGDIITFEQDGYFVTHRIIEMSDNGVVTKGEANNVQDEIVAKELIVGKIVKVFSSDKYNTVKFVCVLFLVGIVIYQIFKKG